MTEIQANVLIAALFFIVSSQYQDDFKTWAAWWLVGVIYMLLASFEGIMRIFL